MSIEQLMFRIFYRVGFTPWDGHALPNRLRSRIEGEDALPPGKALDLGCGTGDTSIRLAKHGWDVTGVDWVERALNKARAKASAAGTSVRFQRADVTKLSREGIGSGFSLLVDSGCFHGMSDANRDAYVREVEKVATPDAFFVLIAFPAADVRRPPRGVDRDEIERRFSGWELLRSEADPGAAQNQGRPLWSHELRRRALS